MGSKSDEHEIEMKFERAISRRMQFAETTSDMINMFAYFISGFIATVTRCNERVANRCDEVRDMLLQCTSISEAWLKCSVAFPDVKKEWVNDFMTWRLDELKIVIDGKEEIVPMRLDNVNVDIFKNQFLGRANRAFFMHFAKTEVASQLKSLANFIPSAFQKMRFKAC